MAASSFLNKEMTKHLKICVRYSKFINKFSNISQRNYGLCFIKNQTEVPEICKNASFFRKFSVKGKYENAQLNKHLVSAVLPFQQQMHLRKQQAQRSVLVELNGKEDIPYAVSVCQQIGAIKNAFSYSGESKNMFLLLEFEYEDSVKDLFAKCQFENISDAFTVSSRIICFKNKFIKQPPASTIHINEEETITTIKSKQKTVSNLIEDIYNSEKITELNTRLRFLFCCLVKDSISGLFPHCEVLPFGSSVNGVGRQSSDLDIMIRLYPLQIETNSELSFRNKTCVGTTRDFQRRTVYTLGDFFNTFLPGFSSVKKILHARVPILKFNHKILGFECDISINNMSAVLMSELLYFCGEIDPRFRPLLYSVKKWAKDASITYEAPGTWITNFALSLLVVFFLQNRPTPILPPLNDAAQIVGEEWSTPFQLEYLSPVSDLKARASSNTESLAGLLREFLYFLSSHPFKHQHISILSGLSTQKVSDSPIWVQYPLEEEKNVTKNVFESDLRDMCDKAYASYMKLEKYLSSNTYMKGNTGNELSHILGIPDILKSYSHRTKRLDVNMLFQAENERNKKKNTKRAF